MLTSSRDRGARAPLLLLVPALVGIAFVALPLFGLLVKTPWDTLPASLGDPVVFDALRLSLASSLGAVLVSALVGVPVAWLLARTTVPGRALIRALVLVPLVLPPVVGGVALLLAFGPRGLLGPTLDRFGVTLPFSTAGTVVAAAFVALPFLVLTVEGALLGLDEAHEDVAATLGAGRLRVFFTVTVPMIGPALVSGLVLAWARALGEFGATLTFAGNIQGVTQTMPLAVYQTLPLDPSAALGLSVVLLGVSAVVVVSMNRWWLPGLSRKT